MSMAMAVAFATVAAGFGFVSVEAFRPISLASQTHTYMQTHTHTQKKPLARTIMYRIRCENKYYQLEELEDAENGTTELFLKEDGMVDIGETDGPLFSKAVGSWEIQENSFAMTITKTFSSGNERNDMGEFTFDVERVFEGEMTIVGGTEVAINGKIFAEDIITEKHELEVGYFNMIDATEQRLERRPDARPKATGVKPSPINSNDVKGHDGIPKEWLQPHLDEERQPQIDPALSAFGGNSGYEQPQQQQQQQQQQQGLSAFGSGSFGQDSQGYGGQQQQQHQQETASNWGSGSGYEQQQQQQQQQQQPQTGGISEYGGGSFGQESEAYGGGGSGYGYGQPQQQQQQAPNDPGPPSFADYGQQQQQQPSNDPGPPSFADYGQQQEADENNEYSDPQNDGYYSQDDNTNSNNNYNGGGGGGLSPMGGGGYN